MADNKISTSHFILTVIVLVCLVIIGFQAVEIKNLNDNRFTLSPGESLPPLELLNLDNNPFNAGILSQGIIVLMCFKTPCFACNSNLNSWNSIAKFFENRVRVIGIIPDGDPAAFRLADEKKVIFPLYAPADVQSLRKKMRLRQNMAQTIIVYNNKIITLKFGDLSAGDLKSLVAAIKSLIHHSREA